MSYQSEVLADSPVLYLRLQETSGTVCADSSASGFTGQTNGTVTRNVATGHAGLGIGVTLGGGVSDFISVPDNNTLDITGDVTYECWANVAALQAAQQFLMGKGSGSTSLHGGYGFLIEPTANGKVTVQNMWTGTAYFTSTGAMPLGAWTHVAFTRSGNTYVIYFNGVQDSTGSNAGLIQDTTQSFDAGHANINNSPSRPLVGSMDEIAVYTTGLSAARIAAHYAARDNAALPPSPTIKKSPPPVIVARVGKKPRPPHPVHAGPPTPPPGQELGHLDGEPPKRKDG